MQASATGCTRWTTRSSSTTAPTSPSGAAPTSNAFADGTVALVGWDAGYGNYVIVEHENDWQTLYAHCSEILVYSGQSVSMGDVIAKSGATGEVTGPHLHFELRKDGTFYNPEFWLA